MPKPKRSKLSSLVLNDENGRDLSAVYNGNHIETEDLNVPGIDFHVETTSIAPLEQDDIHEEGKKNKENVVQVVPIDLNDLGNEIEANVYDKITSLLKKYLVDKVLLLAEYNKSKTKYLKYKDSMYYGEYLTSLTKIDIALKKERDLLKIEIKNFQKKKMESQNFSLDLIPLFGDDKEKYMILMKKLEEIQLLRRALKKAV